MPTSSFVRASFPLRIVCGRPWSKGFNWSAPSGSVIDMTGCAVAAVLRWGASSATLATTEPDATGVFSISTDADTTDLLPPGQFARLVVTITDALGNTLDVLFPIIAGLP